MMKKIFLLLAALPLLAYAQRSETLLTEWQITKDAKGTPDEKGWTDVTVPHDYAISQDFDRKYDLQTVQVVQNGETAKTEKTGRSGGLPWMGSYWYRTTIQAKGVQPANAAGEPQGAQYTLVFDGAMSNAVVYVDGQQVYEWPYGYNTFSVNITPWITNGKHEVSVRLENKPESSRWYPGGGLYRNVHLIRTSAVHVPVWGTVVTTPSVSPEAATVRMAISVENSKGHRIDLHTYVIDLSDGREVASVSTASQSLCDTVPAVQTLTVNDPRLWSPEQPNRYKAVTDVYCDGSFCDSYTTHFGIRTIEYRPDEGFFLNGQHRKFKGVCLHHDFGALGTAVHPDAIRHQLAMLKNMGCDAIRTSHNMPAPELVQLCDEMGLMMIVESFDVWTREKCANDYHTHFSEWAERDVAAMVRHYRNDPCVMMWSVGNEVWNQVFVEDIPLAKWLQSICHREDPTRPVTCGMDQVWAIVDNGFGAAFDIPGLNYRTARYQEAYQKLPQKMILGSETASTVSSRGVYKFPLVLAPDQLYPDNQCTGYDLEYCSWSGLPDQDFALQDDNPWTIGQFVWTGIDYLGEPSPYDTDAWPSHSSYFGIIDLAMLPKDRYWLYRSQWNTSSPTLHALPHWTWSGREGEVTPVFVYTSYPEAEVFINGVSQGRKVFATRENADSFPTVSVGTFTIPSWGSEPQPHLLPRYRLMWLDTKYQPGEMKVYAYAHPGDPTPVDSTVCHTAGKASQLALDWANRGEQGNIGRSQPDCLYYITVSAQDAQGNLCPNADEEVFFFIKGKASIAGVANGNAACLDNLSKPRMHLFAGQCTVIVRASGAFTLSAWTPTMKIAKMQIK